MTAENPIAHFGEIRQIGYVVPEASLDDHLHHWVHVMGIGPWHVYEHLAVEDFVHRGRPGSIDMTIALAHMGSLQVELIAQHCSSPSTYREFLDTTGGRGGLHHLAFWPADMDDAERVATEVFGWEPWSGGRVGPRGRFRYYLTQDHPGTAMELAEQGASRRARFEQMAEESRRFDPRRDTAVIGRRPAGA